MQNTLYHLSPAQKTELLQAIEKIANTTRAARIYCFGSRCTQINRWSPFHAGPHDHNTITLSYYDLLLVLPEGHTGPKATLARLDRRPAGSYSTFYYHVLTHIEFINRLRNHDPFIHHVYRYTALLHHSGPPILCPEPEPFNTSTQTSWWIKGINLARQQYRKAARAAERNDRWQALYCLHRAAVETCMALVVLHTGYRQPGRSLEYLLHCCDNFCLIRTRVFPCNTPEEAELLQQLERAAQTTWHDEALPVTFRVADTLLKRIHKMIELAEALYQQKTGSRVSRPGRATHPAPNPNL